MNAAVFEFSKAVFGGVNAKAAIAFLLAVFLFILVPAELLLVAAKAGRERKIRFRVVLASVFLALLTGEILLRRSGRVATYPETRFGRYVSPYECDGRRYWTWTRDHTLSNAEYTFSRTVNSEGLPDREYETGKRQGEFRIIALGDSFTEGDGAQAADSWPKALESSLGQRAGGVSYSVLNAGVCGSDPAYEYALLRDRLLKYRPDLVIVLVNHSDRQDFVYRGGLERFRRDGSVAYARRPAWEWLYGVSHLSRLVIHAQGIDPSLQRFAQKERLDRESLKKIRATLLEFSRLGREEKFSLLAVFCPYQAELAGIDFLFSAFAAELESRDAIPSLDLRRYFLERENWTAATSQGFYWPLDKHPNARGYAAIARGVEWKMREMGILRHGSCE